MQAIPQNLSAAGPDKIIYQTRLKANQSATPSAFRILYIWLGSICFISSFVFAVAGAWPVSGFLAVDFGLVCGALWVHSKRSQIYEQITIRDHSLKLERCAPWKRTEKWTFPTAWLQVLNDNSEKKRLSLRSHGQTIAVGDFLTPPERQQLARALSRVLYQ